MDRVTLSEETGEKISKFCDKITKSYELDADIGEEFYGHIEDRVLEYLDTHATLSEDDAFLLVKEHFGDPAEVKKLLGAVHGDQSKGAFLRRLGAVLAATIGVELLLQFNRKLYNIMMFVDRMIFPIARDDPSKFTIPFYPLAFVFRNMVLILMPMLLWFILNRWQKRIDLNERVWFKNMQPLFLILVIVMMLGIQVFSPLMTDVFNEGLMWEAREHEHVRAPMGWSPSHPFFDNHFQRIGMYLKMNFFGYNLLFLLAYIVMQLFVWLWWCDMPQNRLKTLSLTGLVWLIYFKFLPFIMPFTWIKFHETSKFFYLKFSTILTDLLFRSGSRHPHHILWLKNQLIELVFFIGIGCLVVLSYYTLTRYNIMDTRMSRALNLKKVG